MSSSGRLAFNYRWRARVVVGGGVETSGREATLLQPVSYCQHLGPPICIGRREMVGSWSLQSMQGPPSDVRCRGGRCC